MVIYTLGFIVLLIYFLYLQRVRMIWNNTKEIDIPKGYNPSTSITVLIPVRNESMRIKKCINSLLSCEYPTELLEIVLIDDHSEDDTVKIIENIKSDLVKILHLKDFLKQSGINAYKKEALLYGIESSNGSLIIMNDGDGFVSKYYLRSMAYYYENHHPKTLWESYKTT